VVDDGREGLGARLAPAAPSLVLLDMQLAGRSGRDALAEIRAQPALASIPVLTFTAAGQDEPVGEGFAGRVAKPVEPDALLAQVDAVLESFAGVPEVEPQEDDDFLAPLRDRFRAGLADRLRAIESAMAAGESEALRRELHKLRGAAGGYGFDALADAAGDAETAVREGGGRAEVQRAAALLRSVAEGG
jgi:CheY-like chemotaxis protein